MNLKSKSLFIFSASVLLGLVTMAISTTSGHASTPTSFGRSSICPDGTVIPNMKGYSCANHQVKPIHHGTAIDESESDSIEINKNIDLQE